MYNANTTPILFRKSIFLLGLTVGRNNILGRAKVRCTICFISFQAFHLHLDILWQLGVAVNWMIVRHIEILPADYNSRQNAYLIKFQDVRCHGRPVSLSP